ncbi:MAG: GntR family transcriptional regulator [Acetobacteraceae bacterium]|nr:GntR family transcriptional regulator [Acetobacteraceae bacterium]
MSLLTPIEPPSSLTDQATAALRRDILTTRLAPGETLSEAAAAQRLSLGKAPIRAALARLAEEGLVLAVPRRGWVVSLVTIRDIHEVFDLRLLLEPEAARRAAGRVCAEALRRLDAVCAAGYRPEDEESALAFLDANKAFHVAVAELSGNARLARQIGRLLDESTRMLVLGLRRRDRTGEMAHEHHALIEALALGRAAEAGRIMYEQVAASREMVLAALTAPDAAIAV